jgi:hypothetical protein
MKAEGEEGTGKPRGYRCELSKNGRQNMQISNERPRSWGRADNLRCWCVCPLGAVGDRGRHITRSGGRGQALNRPLEQRIIWPQQPSPISFSHKLIGRCGSRKDARAGKAPVRVVLAIHHSVRLRLLMRIEE